MFGIGPSPISSGGSMGGGIGARPNYGGGSNYFDPNKFNQPQPLPTIGPSAGNFGVPQMPRMNDGMLGGGQYGVPQMPRMQEPFSPQPLQESPMIGPSNFADMLRMMMQRQ